MVLGPILRKDCRITPRPFRLDPKKGPPLTPSQATSKIDHRLVKALGHPTRVRILAALNERVASPTQLAEEFDEGLSQLSYHIKVLKDLECIELVGTRPRRGAVEHFYRAIARAHLGDPEWREIPE